MPLVIYIPLALEESSSFSCHGQCFMYLTSHDLKQLVDHRPMTVTLMNDNMYGHSWWFTRGQDSHIYLNIQRIVLHCPASRPQCPTSGGLSVPCWRYNGDMFLSGAQQRYEITQFLQNDRCTIDQVQQLVVSNGTPWILHRGVPLRQGIQVMH